MVNAMDKREQNNIKQSKSTPLSAGIALVADAMLDALTEETNNIIDSWLVLKYALVQVETKLELDIAEQIQTNKMMGETC